MRIFGWIVLLACSALVHAADTCVAAVETGANPSGEDEGWSIWALDLEEDETTALSEDQQKEQDEWRAWEAEAKARLAEAKPHMDQYAAIMSQAKTERARTLAKRRDARSLLMAAVLMQSYTTGEGIWRPEAFEYLVSAQHRDNTNPLVWWLTALMCPSGSSVCDRVTALEKLASLDPDNAAVWNLFLVDAESRGDEAAAAHLLRLFASVRYDDYYASVRRLVYDAYRDLDVPTSAHEALTRMGETYGYDYAFLPSDSVALAEAMGLLSAFALQSNTQMVSACSEGELAAISGRRAECLSLFEMIAESSDHLLGRKMAYARLTELNESDADKQVWQEATRRLNWITAQHAELSKLPENVRGYLEHSYRDGEIAAVEQALRENDIPMTPPADWSAESYWQKAMEEMGISVPSDDAAESVEESD